MTITSLELQQPFVLRLNNLQLARISFYLDHLHLAFGGSVVLVVSTVADNMLQDGVKLCVSDFLIVR